ncbi:MAG: transcription elongation factor GreA [Rickettsiales bacterium]|jgi:transcription elongation factor GreA|nr:transcription elongation factor GreA [Rickettsiales bacterium]
MQGFKITREGYNKLRSDLDNLIHIERVKIARAIGEATDLGDLSENTEYSSMRERQLVNEALIATLGDKISSAQIVDVGKLSGDFVDFGATVTLIDEESQRKVCYTLLSEIEANLSKNIISTTSPIGKALLGKRIGDSVEITVPSGTKYYEVIDIKWGAVSSNVN